MTPHYSVLFTGIFMILAIIFLDLKSLVELASALLLLLYILTNFAVIIMRESKIQNYQPRFRSPLYPTVQILGILGCGFLLVEMGKFVLSLAGVFVALGLVWYLIYAGLKVEKEYALIHVIERIINKELTSGTLPQELKGILRERDNIVEDRFDALIHQCEVLDFKESIKLDEFFQKVSQVLSERIGEKEETLYKLLWERERESSTVITSGLAIPHIVIPGEGKFAIVLARCKEGIMFDEEIPPVNTVFVLLGTREERNFHLKALMAIAQIVQNKDFEHNWMKTRTKEDLRNLILIAQRVRKGEV